MCNKNITKKHLEKTCLPSSLHIDPATVGEIRKKTSGSIIIYFTRWAPGRFASQVDFPAHIWPLQHPSQQIGPVATRVRCWTKWFLDSMGQKSHRSFTQNNQRFLDTWYFLTFSETVHLWRLGLHTQDWSWWIWGSQSGLRTLWLAGVTSSRPEIEYRIVALVKTHPNLVLCGALDW